MSLHSIYIIFKSTISQYLMRLENEGHLLQLL